MGITDMQSATRSLSRAPNLRRHRSYFKAPVTRIAIYSRKLIQIKSGRVTIDAYDPGSKQPEFKICAVKLAKESKCRSCHVLIPGQEPPK